MKCYIYYICPSVYRDCSQPQFTPGNFVTRGRQSLQVRLANLSNSPATKIENLRQALRDEPLLSPDAVFTIERLRARDLVVAMIAS